MKPSVLTSVYACALFASFSSYTANSNTDTTLALDMPQHDVRLGVNIVPTKLECNEGEVPYQVGGEWTCSVNSANSKTTTTPMTTEQSLVELGQWGGAGISLTAAETRTDLEFNCALGIIKEPLVLDHDGNFEAEGIYVFEMGGPRTKDSPQPKLYPAMFQGLADHLQMVLTVTVTLQESTRVFGPFSLERGRRAELDRCG